MSGFLEIELMQRPATMFIRRHVDVDPLRERAQGDHEADVQQRRRDRQGK